ncbi:MAG: iron-containing redox enzyme family protein [Actinobacteria bacterium]|nr:iron-containing redox enzyme family protein [Actinomycetota bacterium]
MTLPAPRGPISAAIIAALGHDDPSRLPAPDALPPTDGGRDPLGDDDLQLSLWLCYELHYRGLPEVADHWEWQPELIGVRRELEERLLATLRRQINVPPHSAPVPARLWSLVDNDRGPQLSRYLQREANLEQYREFAIHRSIYQLKEADPHTWAIPRLFGRAKAALVEIQVDEYGDGRADRMHSELYRGLLRGLDLDDGYAAYIDAVPGISMAISNVISLFGLRRELRGALVGHLAAYEMTSSAPCRRYGKGLRRLGFADDVCAFYDVHVTADALHEQLAAHDLCGALAEDEPALSEQIMFGAATSLHVDNRFAEYVLACWSSNRSSLREAGRAVDPNRRPDSFSTVA